MNLISIGYEGLSVETLVSRLRIREATALVDVRLNAISRKRGFSKKALAAALAEAGIEYIHIPELGNHRDNRAGYAELGTVDADAARTTFAGSLSLPSAQEGVRRVRELADAGPVAVFCYEADEKHCHREQVLKAVRECVPAPA